MSIIPDKIPDNDHWWISFSWSELIILSSDCGVQITRKHSSGSRQKTLESSEGKEGQEVRGL